MSEDLSYNSPSNRNNNNNNQPHQSQQRVFSSPFGSSSPFAYFSSLIRKVKGRLSSAHGLAPRSPSSSSPASSYATLPRTAATKGAALRNGRATAAAAGIVIESPASAVTSSVDIYGNELHPHQKYNHWLNSSDPSIASQISSAQIFGTLPRGGGAFNNNNNKNKSKNNNKNCSPSSPAHNQQSTLSSFSGFLLSRSGSVSSGRFQSSKNYRPAAAQLQNQLSQNDNNKESPFRDFSSLHSLDHYHQQSFPTFPNRRGGQIFWEETDSTKQCRALFKDCQRALDSVLFSVEKYFDAVDLLSTSSSLSILSLSQSSPSPAGSPVPTTVSSLSTSAHDSTAFIDVTDSTSSLLSRQQHQQLLSSVNASASELFFLLVELRNILSRASTQQQNQTDQQRFDSWSLSSSSSSFAPQHDTLQFGKALVTAPSATPLRQDFVTTALLIPVGALLSHLARLCDLFALPGGAACGSSSLSPQLSTSDSGISMKSSSTTVANGVGSRNNNHHQHQHQTPTSPPSISSFNNNNNSNQNGARGGGPGGHPLKQQTLHVINSLRETLNRIDEGLPVVPVSVVRKSTSVNDNLPVSSNANSRWKTTVTMNTSDDGTGFTAGGSGDHNNTNNYHQQRSSIRMVVGNGGTLNSSSSTPDRRGHTKLANLEKTLKTVSFDSASPPLDSGSESSPDRCSERTTTGVYDNVECYSPGPEYGSNGSGICPEYEPKQATGHWTCTADLFITGNKSSSPGHYLQQQQQQQPRQIVQQLQQQEPANNNSNGYPREIPVVRTGAPSKPMSPKRSNTTISNQSVPVWVCRQVEPGAALTPPSNPPTLGSNSATSIGLTKRSCSQPPPGQLPPTTTSSPSGPKPVAINFVQQQQQQRLQQKQQQMHSAPLPLQHGSMRPPHPLGQGSCQDILLLDQVDSLLELGEKGVIKSGCTDALIVYASLPSSTEGHRTFVDAFLSTYCTFLNPDQLVDKLIYRFEKMSAGVDRGGVSAFNSASMVDDPKQKLACSTLCLLVHVVSSLSNSDALFRWPSLRSRLAEFVYSLLRRPGLWHLAVALRRELLRAEANLQSITTTRKGDVLLLSPVSLFTQQQSEPQHSSASTNHRKTLLDFRSRRIAEQMTLIDWRLFETLDLSELLVYATQSSGSSSGSNNTENNAVKNDISVLTPRLTNFTRHFNDVSLWARTIILKQDSEKLRERYMLKLAKVVQYLRQLQNFNSSLALLSALDSAAVRRLASAARVAKRIKSVVNGLRDLTDSSQSFRAYRLILENCHPPAIPYLGLTLQDLTFVHIGSPDVLPEDAVGGTLINFSKRLQQHRILESVRRFKCSHAVYNFSPDMDILVFFDNFSDHWDEEKCWNVSERLKPRTPMGSSANCSRQANNSSNIASCVSSATHR